MKQIGNRMLGAALAAWLLSLASCGNAPTAPRLTSYGTVEPGTAGGLKTAPAAGAQQLAGPSASLPNEIGPVVLPPNDDPTAYLPLVTIPPTRVENGLELIAPVVGALGSMMKVGDITVKIPKNAIGGNVQVKVTVPDSSRLECHLEIFPASMNHFAVPVRLEFDASNAADFRVMTVYWFDESQQAWVQLDSTYDPMTRKVWAELPHFSIYKADSEIQGRAGW